MLRSVFGLLGWLVRSIYLINPAWMAWSQLALASWIRWMGAVLMAFCVPPSLLGIFQPGEKRYPNGCHPPEAYVGGAWSISLDQAPAIHRWIPVIHRS